MAMSSAGTNEHTVVQGLTESLVSLSTNAEKAKEDDNFAPLCCVCQDISVNPVKLPCSHIFCYLCVKGVAVRSGKCALCRQLIPSSYIDKPNILNTDILHSNIFNTEKNIYHWFYEAKNGGWWMYEDRTSADIEKGYLEKLKSVKVQISGFCYIVDFEMMIQFRDGFPQRRRKIKRDILSGQAVKGVAGIIMGSSKLVPVSDQQGKQDY